MNYIKSQSEADDLVLESPREVAGAGGLVTDNGSGGFDALFDVPYHLMCFDVLLMCLA